MTGKMSAPAFHTEPIDPAVFANTMFEQELRGHLVSVRGLGFAALQQEGTDDLRIIGFHADEQGRRELVPALCAKDRQPDRRKLDDNAKGYGIILGNTAQAIRRPRATDRERQVGVYQTPVLGYDEITALQHGDPTAWRVMLPGIARHAILKAREQLQGSDRAIQTVEKRYGSASLATFDPAPLWLLKQPRRDYPIPPVWAIWRDYSRRPLTRIGTVAINNTA